MSGKAAPGRDSKMNSGEEDDAGDAQFLASAIKQHRDVIAGPELVGAGEGFADEHLAAAGGSEPSAGSEEEAVEFRGVRSRAEDRTVPLAGSSRPGISRVTWCESPGCTAATPGSAAHAIGHRVGRPA